MRDVEGLGQQELSSGDVSRGKQLCVPAPGDGWLHTLGGSMVGAALRCLWVFGASCSPELQLRRHWAGSGEDFGHWDIIGGMAVGDSMGKGARRTSRVPCTLPEVAAGSSATLPTQEKEISRSRMPPRSWAATSLPLLSPSMEHPALSIPAWEQPAGRVQAQAGLRFLCRGAKSPETFLLIKV